MSVSRSAVVNFICLVLAATTGTITDAPAQFKNIKVTEEGLLPTVVVNPKNTKKILVATGPNRVHASNDGGLTWNEIIVQSPYGVSGDPSLLSNTHGNIVFFHLTNPDGRGTSHERFVCQESGDDGKTWSLGSPIGYNPPKEQDHVRAAAHPRKNSLCVTWTEFDKYRVADSTCQSNILFSESSNGIKWSKPVTISQLPGDCQDKGNSLTWSMPVMDTDKKIFIVWASQGDIVLDRSYNQGDKWLNTDMAVVKRAGGAYLTIPGILQCPRVPVLAIDNSDSFFKNSLYLTWADQRNGSNDTDIFFLRSTNRGDYWTLPLRINQDPVGRHQFMPAMVVDPATGVIYVVYFDRRNYADQQTDVYLAYSRDGGDKFTEVKISEKPFVPTADVPFSGQIGLSVYKGVIAPVWTRMDEGKTSVWTAIVRQEDLIKKEDMPKLQSTRRNSQPYRPPVPNQNAPRRKTS